MAKRLITRLYQGCDAEEARTRFLAKCEVPPGIVEVVGFNSNGLVAQPGELVLTWLVAAQWGVDEP